MLVKIAVILALVLARAASERISENCVAKIKSRIQTEIELLPCSRGKLNFECAALYRTELIDTAMCISQEEALALVTVSKIQ